MTVNAKLLAAIGVAFGLLYPVLWALPAPGWVLIAAKGAGVGFLALAAVRSARETDGWLLALVLGLGSAGDVLLEVNFAAGAATFALGHAVAIWLYLRNGRPGGAGLAVPRALLGLAVIGPFLLLRGQEEQIAFTVYGAMLGAMAGCAWLSRFPRKMVAAGALLFVASDLLIAARLGMDARPWVLGLAIWYLYFAGQLLIYLGVSGVLAARNSPSPSFA